MFKIISHVHFIIHCSLIFSLLKLHGIFWFLLLVRKFEKKRFLMSSNEIAHSELKKVVIECLCTLVVVFALTGCVSLLHLRTPYTFPIPFFSNIYPTIFPGKTDYSFHLGHQHCKQIKQWSIQSSPAKWMEVLKVRKLEGWCPLFIFIFWSLFQGASYSHYFFELTGLSYTYLAFENITFRWISCQKAVAFLFPQLYSM